MVKPRGGRTAAWHLAALLLAAGLIAWLHSRSLRYGLFLDDFAHFTQLRAAGWSLGDLAGACRLELIGPIIDYWWLPDVTLRFFRPVSFGLMKLVYVASHWSPAAQHGASLVWHLICFGLLAAILRSLGGRLLPAYAVALLFALHPAHTATVEWLAAQTELVVTAFILIAVLCYGRLRGWSGANANAPDAPARSGGWLVGVAVCFAAALGCRENAIMLPLVLAAGELPRWRNRSNIAADGGRGRRSALQPVVVLGLLALIAVAYVAVRSVYLGGAAVPPRPYVVPPTAPDFPRYALDKLCYYLIGEFFLVPCLPIAGLAFFRQYPLILYGGAAVTLAVMAWLTWRRRGSAIGWLAPACLLGFMAPLIPAYEAPHHLYLPGIGWAMYLLMGWQEIAGWLGQLRPAARRVFEAGGGLAAAGLAALFALSSRQFSLTMEAAASIQNQVVQEVLESPRPVRSGDTIYFANMPLLAHYLKLMLETRGGLHDLQVRALTWSPNLTGVDTPTELVPENARAIRMRIADAEWFDGPLGLLVREANLGKMPYTLNQPTAGRGFQVTPLAVDEHGIRELLVEFEQPLSSPGVHLFWGSATRWARQIPTNELEPGK